MGRSSKGNIMFRTSYLRLQEHACYQILLLEQLLPALLRPLHVPDDLLLQVLICCQVICFNAVPRYLLACVTLPHAIQAGKAAAICICRPSALCLGCQQP